MIETKHYTIEEILGDPYGEFWVQHESGDGMTIGAVELDKLLDEYFKENF